MNPKLLKWAEWALKALVSLIFLAAGAANLAGVMTEALLIMGFPAYMTIVLCVGYFIGIACIWQPWVPFLQEWAWGG